MNSEAISRQDVIVLGDGVSQEIAEAVAMATARIRQAWAVLDTEQRRTILAEVCVDDVDYSNPLMRSSGIDAMAKAISLLISTYPGYLPARTSGIDVHHHTARYTWAMRDSSGHPALQGIEIVCFTPEGRLTSLTSFFGDPPLVRYTFHA